MLVEFFFTSVKTESRGFQTVDVHVHWFKGTRHLLFKQVGVQLSMLLREKHDQKKSARKNSFFFSFWL
jgi:hypothetical protein